MSDERFTTKRLLVLRKLTRALADLLRGQVKDYLTALGPLLRPRTVLGEFTDGGKESVRGAEAAFKELQSLYEAVAVARPFSLPKELTPPLEVSSSVVEVTPLEYTHTAKTNGDSKVVTITGPLKWVLSYSGFSPRRLKELLVNRTTTNELRESVLHMLMMHVVMARQAGAARILEALRCPVSTGRLPGCGELPITFVSSLVTTMRPPDDVIVESTEISGTDSFEEVVNLDEMAKLNDPFKERLIELVRSHGEDLLPRGESELPKGESEPNAS